MPKYIGLKYGSNVFLGLALDKQEKNDESERAYFVAAESKPRDVLVWQGLINLYEKQAGKKLDGYQNAALQLAEIFMEAYVLRTSSFYGG